MPGSKRESRHREIHRKIRAEITPCFAYSRSMSRHSITVETPTGPVSLTEEDGKIIRASWSLADEESPTPLLEDAARQLRDYFDGKRTDFDLPLRPKGSEFQKAVWRQMLKIPYGGTKTYGELAKAIDGTARSVGTACGANPIPVIIPCHRVVGADGTMTGFSGGDGVETKQALLRLEGALLL